MLDFTILPNVNQRPEHLSGHRREIPSNWRPLCFAWSLAPTRTGRICFTHTWLLAMLHNWRDRFPAGGLLLWKKMGWLGGPWWKAKFPAHQAKPVVSWSRPAKAKVPLKSVSRLILKGMNGKSMEYSRDRPWSEGQERAGSQTNRKERVNAGRGED